MDFKYQRLIVLAEEIDTPSTAEKARELNILLSEVDKNIIDQNHYHLLDDLITILLNTGNIFDETQSNINALQSFIRGEI